MNSQKPGRDFRHKFFPPMFFVVLNLRPPIFVIQQILCTGYQRHINVVSIFQSFNNFLFYFIELQFQFYSYIVYSYDIYGAGPHEEYLFYSKYCLIAWQKAFWIVVHPSVLLFIPLADLQGLGITDISGNSHRREVPPMSIFRLFFQRPLCFYTTIPFLFYLEKMI